MIRGAQVERLAADSLRRFHADLARSIAAVFPERHVLSPELDQFVEDIVRRGRAAGIRKYSELEFWTFAHAALNGTAWPESDWSWARALLRDRDLDGPAKVAILKVELRHRKDDLLPTVKDGAAWLRNL